jgi:hypothetical protein
MFEDRALRKMFVFERMKVNRGWITLHTEKLRNFYLSPNRLREIESREKRGERHMTSPEGDEQGVQFSGQET